MPGWEARAALEGAPAGSDPKRRSWPPAPDPASMPAVTGESPLLHVAGPLCPLVCLRIPWEGEGHRDRCGGRCA
jgi:hypothetical protein